MDATLAKKLLLRRARRSPWCWPLMSTASCSKALVP
jgi:hypothetical protein